MVHVEKTIFDKHEHTNIVIIYEHVTMLTLAQSTAVSQYCLTEQTVDS